jgi:hypothetical protein
MEQRITKSEIAPITVSDVLLAVRAQIRDGIQKILEEELAAALGAFKGERSEERRGYRNGALERTVTTERGEETLRVPRGRIAEKDGTTGEWHRFESGADRAFNKTILNEFYQVAFRRKLYRSIEDSRPISTRGCGPSTERTHQGRWCFGKTPMQTFLDSISLAKEKMLVT